MKSQTRYIARLYVTPSDPIEIPLQGHNLEEAVAHMTDLAKQAGKNGFIRAAIPGLPKGEGVRTIHWANVLFHDIVTATQSKAPGEN